VTSRDFCYWLQGFFELAKPDAELTIEQKHIIKNHLAMVFKHEIDPSAGQQAHQDVLNQIHNQKPDKPAGDPPGTLYRC